MKKVNSTSFTSFLGACLFAAALLFSQSASAQGCTLVCNNLVQISLNDDCSQELEPDMILEGNSLCPNGNLQVQAKINGIWVPANGNGNYVVTSANINQTIQVRVRDLVSGNNCSGFMFVEDKLAPVLTCLNITIPCAVTNYTPSYLDDVLDIAAAFPSIDENCTNTTQTYSDTYTDLACNASINGISGLSAYVRRVWTVVDASGNQASCTQFIYFDRVDGNEVLLPADVTVDCSNPSTGPAFTGAPFVTVNGNDISLFPNNTACELNIVFADQILPVCDGTYKILRTWTIYDWCKPTVQGSNPIYHIQLIKVEDADGPVAECPENITVTTNPFDCERDLDLPDFFVSDNCSRLASVIAQYNVNGIGYTINGNFSNFPGNNKWIPDTLGVVGVAQNLPLGTTLITYVISDDCGNTATCAFNVTVEDDVPPAAVCDEFTQVSLGSNGEIFVNASTFDDGSYDNCSPVQFKARRMDNSNCQSNGFFYDQVKFCCEDVGDTITVIFRVYDVPVPAGQVNLDFEEFHANDCMVQVYVDDKIKPVCQAPANVTVSCENFDPSLWAYGQPIATDNCCLDTVTTTVNLSAFDSLCNKGTIIRRFTAIDCGGQQTQCSQRIIVNYEQDYYVRFPNDVIVTFCDSSGIYGEPTFFGEDCELLGVSFQDQVFTVVPDACFKIERTWKIINWCTYDPNAPCINVPNPTPNATENSPANLPGPIVSPLGTPNPWAPTVVRIKSTDPAATNYSTFWNANANCYVYKQIIKIIDTQDPIIAACPTAPVVVGDLTPNDPQFYNANYFWDPITESHDLCEAPGELTVSATDLCSGTDLNFSYLLFIDIDQNGTMETVISSNNLPGFNNINVGNAVNPNFVGGAPSAFDFRPVPTNQKYGFALQTTISGNTKTARVAWNTAQSPNSFVTPQFPHGIHKIKWLVNDNCGNESVCEYTIEVKDGKAPTVVCINGLSVNIMPTGMITLWDTDFLQYKEDNCTPAAKVITGIRRAGAGTGFPRDAQGNPIKNVTFDCTQTGTQFVELWAEDLAGNADFCETYLIVQDPNGICQPGNKASVAGAAKTDFNNPATGVQGVDMDITGAGINGAAPINMVSQTSNQGAFNFSGLPVSGNYTLTPEKDSDPLNGVSTYDLVLISKHILGLDPLNTPYKMIAADANKSGSITTFDIVEIRKLILGIYSELPSNTSWRFVDKSFKFPNMDNPFQTNFPESMTIAPLLAGGYNNADFVGVKVGDVNGTAIANNLVSANDRSAGNLYFDVQDQQVKAGEVVTVAFNAADATAAYQFTMNLNGLEVVDVNLNDDNYAVFADALTCSVDGKSGAFEVTFRATQNGTLSSMIAVSNRITKAEGYTENGERLEVAFRFDGNTVAGAGFELLQNVPNPASDLTQISFHLPEAADATLTISNVEGRIVKTINGAFNKGLNTISLDATELESGILFYQLDTPTHSASKKMVVVK
jgi:hypothetical protein